MQAYPDGFQEALSVNHESSLVAWIQDGTGARLYNFPPIVNGVVSIDRNASTVRSLRVVVADYAARDLAYAAAMNSNWSTPDGADGLLAPYGNEIVVARGTSIRGYTDPFWGNDQVFQYLGVFRISNAAVSTESPGGVQVTAYDRSRTVGRNGFTVPYVIALGSNTVDAIVALVQDRLPSIDVPLTVTPSDEVTPLIVLDPGMNPWAEGVQKLATSIGYDCYFGASGDLVLKPDPYLNGTESVVPVWNYIEGDSSQLLRAEKDTSDEPGYNGVVLTAESQTLATPLRSEVWDTNPDSPTYADGPYGRVPKFETSPYVANQVQADAAATTILRREMGGTEGLSYDAIPNTALEPNDPVLVRSAVQRIDHVAMVDQIEMPLHVTESMRVVCRRYRSLT